MVVYVSRLLQFVVTSARIQQMEIIVRRIEELCWKEMSSPVGANREGLVVLAISAVREASFSRVIRVDEENRAFH